MLDLSYSSTEWHDMCTTTVGLIVFGFGWFAGFDFTGHSFLPGDVRVGAMAGHMVYALREIQTQFV